MLTPPRIAFIRYTRDIAIYIEKFYRNFHKIYLYDIWAIGSCPKQNHYWAGPHGPISSCPIKNMDPFYPIKDQNSMAARLKRSLGVFICIAQERAKFGIRKHQLALTHRRSSMNASLVLASVLATRLRSMSTSNKRRIYEEGDRVQLQGMHDRTFP